MFEIVDIDHCKPGTEILEKLMNDNGLTELPAIANILNQYCYNNFIIQMHEH